MPQLTRWYIHASFLYLLASLFLGILLSLQRPLALPAIFGLLGPVYLHLFLVGWVTQLIFGVIFWLFPKQKSPATKWESVGMVTWVLLNVGLLLRVIAEPQTVLRAGVVWGWALVLSAVLQWLAGIGLIYIVWPRVYTRKRKQR
jgi:hypothetical protein